LYIHPCRNSLPVPGARPFTCTRAGKVSQSLELDLLHSPVQEKTPGPLSEIIYCTFPHAGKVSRSPEQDLLQLPVQEKSPGPWSETFYIDPCRKSLPVPWARSSTFPHAGKVSWSLEQNLLHSPVQEKSPGPWSETFYIHPCRKVSRSLEREHLHSFTQEKFHSLLPGARPFTFTGTGNVSRSQTFYIPPCRKVPRTPRQKNWKSSSHTQRPEGTDLLLWDYKFIHFFRLSYEGFNFFFGGGGIVDINCAYKGPFYSLVIQYL
jgi:hypothetical protein